MIWAVLALRSVGVGILLSDTLHRCCCISRTTEQLLNALKLAGREKSMAYFRHTPNAATAPHVPYDDTVQLIGRKLRVAFERPRTRFSAAESICG